MALFINRSKCLINSVFKTFAFRANYGSALFVTGNKGIDVCPPVIPYIDFEDRLTNLDSLKNIVKRRNQHLDVDQIRDVWEFLAMLRDNFKALDNERSSILNKINTLMGLDDDYSKEEIVKYRMHMEMVKHDIKNLKIALWSVEENAVISALSFPNAIHPKTPDTDEFEIYTFNERPVLTEAISHLEIANKADLVKFTNPHNYYLKKDAAVFELCGKYFFSNNLRNAGYTQFSNPDFTKSAIVEGCGLNHTDPDKVFIMHHTEVTKMSEDNRLHLTGGASALSFAAYHTRNIVLPTQFPLKYFSLGRQYIPVPITCNLGLFQVSQSSVVQLFIAVKDSIEDLDTELNKAVDLITDIYKNIGYHFKVCRSPATKLKSWETLHVGFQMYSPALKSYVEVGYISIVDNYISKRLHFSYKEDGKKFPKMISGSILSIPKLLGCILEQNPEKPFEISPALKNALYV